jgi:flagellin
MGLRIQNNITALNAHRQLTIADAGLTRSLERLSSGYRINRAADDSAGLAISRGLRSEIAGFKIASQNASQANSMLQIAEGAMDQIHNILIRLRELATQAASDNVTSTERTYIAAEADKLVAEIDRIVDSTKYSGQLLIDGSFGVTKTGSWSDPDNLYDLTANQDTDAGVYSVTEGTNASGKLLVTLATGGVTQALTLSDGAQTVNFSTFGISFKTTAAFDADVDSTISDITVSTSGSAGVFQIGVENNSDNRLTVSITDCNANQIGSGTNNNVNQIGSGGSYRLTSRANAQKAIDIIDDAIDDISSARAGVGAYQNRLTYAAANLATVIENTQAAESVIADVDMAAEMTEFTKNQILLQAGTAMLAQANLAPQQVLALFS